MPKAVKKGKEKRSKKTKIHFGLVGKKAFLAVEVQWIYQALSGRTPRALWGLAASTASLIFHTQSVLVWQHRAGCQAVSREMGFIWSLLHYNGATFASGRRGLAMQYITATHGKLTQQSTSQKASQKFKLIQKPLHAAALRTILHHILTYALLEDGRGY